MESLEGSKWLRAGTPAYMAPELHQFYKSKEGENRKINLALTDVFSIGVIYYELLSEFSTGHERSEKLNKLKEGSVMGLQGMSL